MSNFKRLTLAINFLFLCSFFFESQAGSFELNILLNQKRDTKSDKKKVISIEFTAFIVN